MSPSCQCLWLILQTSDIKTLQEIIQTQHKPSFPLLYFYSCVILLCLSQNGTCSLFCSLLVVCELYKGILRPGMDLCHPAFLSSLAQSQQCLFPHLISSKSGYPMKLHLRFKQIHHYTHDNNAIYVFAFPIRKIPLFCTNFFFPILLKD